MATINDKMTAIADAIREKTGGTELLGLDAMAAAIAALETGGGLPESIAKIDGGTVTLSSTHSSGDYIIEHNLGEYPDMFVIYNVNDITTLKTRSMRYYLILYGRYTYNSTTYDGLTARAGDNYHSTGRIAVSSIGNYFDNREIIIPYAYQANLVSANPYAWVAVTFAR